jgi:hypothetical protein
MLPLVISQGLKCLVLPITGGLKTWQIWSSQDRSGCLAQFLSKTFSLGAHTEL